VKGGFVWVLVPAAEKAQRVASSDGCMKKVAASRGSAIWKKVNGREELKNAQ
jgi:hypothetical protein